MRKAIVRAATAATLLAVLPPPPGTAEKITLSQALTRARENAPEIAVARARQEASELRLEQAQGHRLPAVRLQEIWMRTDSPAEVFALQLNQKRFSFPDFLGSDPNNPDPLESATTRLEVEVPLYTGGELGSRIEQAALASQAAASEAIWAAERASQAAAEAYIQLAQSRQHVALLERSLATVNAHVEVAKAYSDQGMLVRSELLRAQVEQARIEDMLSQARGMARVAAANLSFRLAVPRDTEWELETLPEPPPIERSLGSWIDSSRKRADLDAARKMLEAGKLESKALRSGLRPRLGVVARHDLVDDSLFGNDANSTAIMAFGSIELWRGGTHRKAARAAEAEVESADREVIRFEEGVALEVGNAFEQASSALDRFATAIKALEAAAETERITEERFAQGVVKTIDLLDASTARREAEMREIVARADAHLARFRLAVAAGEPPESALAGMTHDPTNRVDTGHSTLPASNQEIAR